MAELTRLDAAVCDHLWSRTEPQTARQVHEALSARCATLGLPRR